MQVVASVRASAARLTHSTTLPPYRLLSTSSRLRSTTNPSSESPENSKAQPSQNEQKAPATQPTQKKTMAQLDEELRLKLEGMSGEGGAAGIELEDGKPVAMKRGVKDNMFRLI